MQTNHTIERFRSELKKRPEKAAIILSLYGVHLVTQPLQEDDDEQERISTIKQMIDELTRSELLAIFLYAIQISNK